MLKNNVAPSQPTPKKKHRALVDPWFAIDSIKQDCLYRCHLPIDSKIEFSDRIATLLKTYYLSFVSKGL